MTTVIESKQNASDELKLSEGYHRVACYIQNDFIGYLGSEGFRSASIINDKNSKKLALCKWDFDGGKRYLRKDTDPGDTYLGWGTDNSAGFGLWDGGYVNALTYNNDQTISIEGTQQKLYAPDGAGGWVYWTTKDTPNNATIIRCVLE